MEYLYLLAVCCFFILFLHAFWKRPDLRLRMVVIGVLTGLLSLYAASKFSIDYWRPPLIFRFGSWGGPEDFIFGFVAGGWGSVIYEVYLRRRLRSGYRHHYWIVPTLAISLYLSVGIGMANGLNSIYASSIGFLIPTLLIILIRRDLLADALFSGLVFGGILVVYETAIILLAPSYPERFFLLYDQMPAIGKAPVTEVIWGFCAGAVFGVIYEFYSGKRSVGTARSKRPPLNIHKQRKSSPRRA